MRSNKILVGFGRHSGWGVVFGITFVLINSLSAATTSWTGDHDSNWGDGRNWTSGVPGAGDAAVVNSGYVNAGGGRSVASLSVGGGSVGGLSTLATPSLSISGGTVSAEAVNAELVNLSGGSLSAGSTAIATGGSWSGGTISGAITVSDGATVSIPSGSTRLGGGAVLNNYGTVQMSGGQIEGYSSCTVNNHGTWVLANNATPFTNYHGGNVFNNHGLLRRTSGEDPINLSNSWTFNLIGETRCESGELRFATTVNLPGGALLSGGAIIRMTAAATNLSGVITETVGSLVLDGATLVCSETAAVTGTLDWASGYLSNTLTVPVGSTLVVTGDGFRRMNTSSVIENRGMFRWEGSSPIEGYNSVIINNHSGATFDLAVDGDPFSQYHGGNVFQNDGLLLKSSGLGVTQLKIWTYHNNGVVQCNTGVIECVSVINLHGDSFLTGAGEVWLNGDIRMDGNVTETVALLRMIGGSLVCNDPCQWTGQLDWEAGTIHGVMGIPTGSVLAVHGEGFKRLGTSTEIDVEGVYRWTGPAAVEGYDSCRLNILPGGVCDLAADGDPFNEYHGGSELINEGTLVKSASSGGKTVCDIWTYRHRGELRCDVSTLEFTNTLILEDASSITGEGEVLLNGIVSMGGDVSESIASLRMIGGSLSYAVGSQVIGELDWEVGTIYGVMGIPAGSALNVKGEGFKRLATSTEVNVEGVYRWIGPAAVEGYQNCRLNILPGGVCDLVADGDPFNQHHGGSELINEGTLVKSAGEGGTSLCNDWTYRQRGEFRCDVSTLVFSSALYFEDSSTVSGAGDVLVSGSSYLNGSVNFTAPTTWVGGTLTGNGGVMEGLLIWSGGYSAGEWQIGPTGTLEIVEGSGELKQVDTGSVIGVGGSLKLSSGALRGYSAGARIEVLDGGRFTVVGTGVLNKYHDGARLEVKAGGAMDSEPGADLRVDWAVDNNGTVGISSGMVKLNGGGMSGGKFSAVASGALHYTAGTHSLAEGAEVSGPGEVKVIGGVLNATVPAECFVHLAGGTVQGSGETGDFQFKNGSQWSSGYLSGQTRVLSEATLSVSGDTESLRRMNTLSRLDVDGRLLWQGPGAIQGYNSCVVEVATGGVLEVAGDGEVFAQYHGGNSLVNHGKLLRSSSDGEATIRHFVTSNDGRIEASTGSLVFRTSLALADGSVISGAGRTVVAEGRTSLAGTTNVSGSTFELAGAELYSALEDQGVITGSTMEWSSGSVTGTVTLDGVATTVGDGFRRLNTSAELRNAGVFSLAGSGTIQSYNSSILRNLSGATLQASGGVSLSMYHGGNQLINEGTMTIGSSPGRMVVGYPFVQTATGRLEVGVAGPDSGNPDFDILQINSTASIAGTLVAVLENGYDPPVGTRFEILTSYGRGGVFQSVESSRFSATYPLIGDPPRSQNNVVLVANASSSFGYEDWIESYGLSGDEAGEEADPDRDGSSNLVEYGLRMNPTLADVPPVESGIEIISGESWLVLHYRRWTDRMNAGLVYGSEASRDLLDWSDEGVVDELDPDAAVIQGSEGRRCRVLVDGGEKFLRLVFSLPGPL